MGYMVTQNGTPEQKVDTKHPLAVTYKFTNTGLQMLHPHKVDKAIHEVTVELPVNDSSVILMRTLDESSLGYAINMHGRRLASSELLGLIEKGEDPEIKVDAKKLFTTKSLMKNNHYGMQIINTSKD